MTITHEQIRMDLRVECTGVHAAGTTTWTSPCPGYFSHAVVLSSGTLVAVTKTGATTFTAAGNYAGAAILGALPTYQVELSQFVPHDQQGVPIKDQIIVGLLTLLIHNQSNLRLTVSHTNSTTRPDETYNFTPDLTNDTGRFVTMAQNIAARAEDCRIKLSNGSSYLGCRVVGIEYEYAIQGGLR